jgi:LEA14-like dessication related protein
MRPIALGLALALSLGAAAAGCAHKKPPPPPAPIPVALPLVAFEGVKLDELKFSGTTLTFECRVENPNPFPVSVWRVRFGLQLEGRPAGTGEVEVPFAVPAAGADGVAGRGSIAFPVVLRFAAVPGFVQVMAREKEAGYALSGAVSFRTPHGVVDVPMAYAGTLPVPRAPKIDVLKLTMRPVTSRVPTEIVLELLVRLGNTNAFPIPSAHVDYGLVISDKEIARAEGRLAAPLLPGEAAELAVPITISLLKAGKAAARFLLPFASLDVSLRGHVEFDGVPVPLDLAAAVVPQRKGT